MSGRFKEDTFGQHRCGGQAVIGPLLKYARVRPMGAVRFDSLAPGSQDWGTGREADRFPCSR
jgi:hypothetical protein